MSKFDGTAFGEQMTEIVKNFVTAAVSPLKQEIATLKESNSTLEKRLEEMQNTASQVEVKQGDLIKSLSEQIETGIKAFETPFQELSKAFAALEPAPVLPDIPALVADSVRGAMHEAHDEVESRVRATLPDADAIKAMIAEGVKGLNDEAHRICKTFFEAWVSEMPSSEEIKTKLTLAINDFKTDLDAELRSGLEGLSQTVTDQIEASKAVEIELKDTISTQLVAQDSAFAARMTAAEEKLAAQTEDWSNSTYTRLEGLVKTSSEFNSKRIQEMESTVDEFKAKLEPYPTVQTIEEVCEKIIERGVMTYFVENVEKFKGDPGEPGTSFDPSTLEPALLEVLKTIPIEDMIQTKATAFLSENTEQFRGEPGASFDPETLAPAIQLALENVPIKQFVFEEVATQFDSRATELKGEPGVPGEVDKVALTSIVEQTVEQRLDIAVKAFPLAELIADSANAILLENADKFKGLPGEPAPVVEMDYSVVEQQVKKFIDELNLPDDLSAKVNLAVVKEFEARKEELTGPMPSSDDITQVVEPLLTHLVRRATESIPEELTPVVEAKVNEAVSKIPAAPAGKDGVGIEKMELNAGELIITLTDESNHAVKLLGIEELDQLAGLAAKKIPAPKDGVGLAGAVIDRAGELVVTLTNGQAVPLGPVVGKDADVEAIKTSLVEHVTKTIAAIPAPKDGLNGVGFDDMDVSLNSESKELVITAKNGDNEKEWKFFVPFLIDKGVYKDNGTVYLEGDGTTFGGSFWIANKSTSAKPGSSEDWRLAVKKGRDGKDREKLPEGPKTSIPLGPQGG